MHDGLEIFRFVQDQRVWWHGDLSEHGNEPLGAMKEGVGVSYELIISHLHKAAVVLRMQ